VETVNFDEDVLNTDNITETFAWKKEGANEENKTGKSKKEGANEENKTGKSKKEGANEENKTGKSSLTLTEFGKATATAIDSAIGSAPTWCDENWEHVKKLMRSDADKKNTEELRKLFKDAVASSRPGNSSGVLPDVAGIVARNLMRSSLDKCGTVGQRDYTSGLFDNFNEYYFSYVVSGLKLDYMKAAVKEKVVGVNDLRKNGRTALIQLGFCYNWPNKSPTTINDSMNFLLDKGTKVNFESKNAQGFTVLHVMARTLHGGVDKLNEMKLLQKKGGIIDAQDKKGYTPLMYAAENRGWLVTEQKIGTQQVFEAKLKFYVETLGANINLKNNYGNTVLDILKARNQDELAQKLIDMQSPTHVGSEEKTKLNV